MSSSLSSPSKLPNTGNFRSLSSRHGCLGQSLRHCHLRTNSIFSSEPPNAPAHMFRQYAQTFQHIRKLSPTALVTQRSTSSCSTASALSHCDHWSYPVMAGIGAPRCQATAGGAEPAASEAPAAALIDGQAIAAQIRKEIAQEVSSFVAQTGRAPGLGVLLVGSRKDSQTYVRMKKKMCQEVGIYSVGVDLPEDSTEEQVKKAVEDLNSDPKIDGVLVQLPLPKHLSPAPILGLVSPSKDVDGFHPLNVGLLALSNSSAPDASNPAPLFVPCTPLGCLELLHRTGVQIHGKKAAVIGRSNVVGLPASLLLQRENATVTVIHSHTPSPAAICREADIVIAAAGVPLLVKGDWVKPGATVIDVGINPVKDESTPRGYRLVGDVDFQEVSKVASAITPVPGGVGPMTIAMLLRNTLTSAQRSSGLLNS